MNRWGRTRLVLERLVLQLWLCTILALAMKVAGDTPPEAQVRSFAGPVACQPDASPDDPGTCALGSQLGLVGSSDSPAARYLVMPVSAPPCSALHRLSDKQANLDTVLDALLAGCGVSLAQIDDDDSMSPHSSSTACEARLMASDEITAGYEVVAGPWGEDGQPLSSHATEPYLTVFPGVAITEEILDLLDLMEWVRGDGKTPLAAWHGAAFSGWLAFPLLHMAADQGTGIRAQSLLRRVGRAVASRPRPSPVHVDLAGLDECPNADTLELLKADLEGIGFKSFGYRSSENEDEFHWAHLGMGEREYAVILSFRVGLEDETCKTLPAIEPGTLIDALDNQLRRASIPPFASVIVFLHWVDPHIDPETRAALIAEALEESGASLVVGFERAAANGLATHAGGLGIVNAGMFLDDRGILPSAVGLSGLTVQCTRVANVGDSCSVDAVAQSLGVPVPVATPSCPGCNLLPADFFRAVWQQAPCSDRNRSPRIEQVPFR